MGTKQTPDVSHAHESLPAEMAAANASRQAYAATGLSDAALASLGGEAVTRYTPDGHLRNQAAENLTGWQAVDAHGRPLTAILHLLDEPTRQPMTVPLTR
jgi:hypothetical protein